MNPAEPVVRIETSVEGGRMHLSYEVANPLDVAVFVFDRLYDVKASKLFQDWVYSRIDETQVALSQQIWPLPYGLLHENPEVPYARLLNAEAKLSGKLVLPLPLIERDPYYEFRHLFGKTVEVKLNRLVFRVGWARVSDLRGGSSVELDGDKLVLFPYHEAILKQKLANSPPVTVGLPGIASRQPAFVFTRLDITPCGSFCK